MRLLVKLPLKISILVLSILGMWAAPINAVADSLAALSHSEPHCDFGPVVFDLNFSGARIDGCKKTGSKEYSLVTAPENRPINPSAWYAFRVYSERKQTINVYLHYAHHQHRYTPKISSDGENWTRLESKNIKVLFDGKAIRLKLKVGPEPLWVSAQEIMDNSYYRDWIETMDALPFMQSSLLGESLEGREILKVESLVEDSRPYVALVGRQHPPEITGAMGMDFFVNRLLQEDDLANRFRAAYGLLIVPVLNPDGVEHGNWRHNMGGIDLNRDWGPFAQPETQLMRDELARFLDKEGSTLDLFLDFHSTGRDVFYTNPDEYIKRLKEFSPAWFSNLEKRIQRYQPDYEVAVKPGHNPNRAVSKKYVTETFGIPAITVEFGDHTDRELIQVISVAAAEEMMKLLLSYQD